MLRGGVFGFGNVGQHMTRVININKWHGEDVRIVAAANRGKEKRDLAQKEYGLAVYETIDDLIGHGLDFILIVSQSHVHRDAAVKVARAGIPFVLEKPIALTEQDALDIVQETEKAGVINAVNYIMRYNPVYVKMKQMVDSGQLGQVLSVWSRSFRGHGLHMNGWRHRAIVDPKESGGWIVHHLCHIVDFCIWVAGEVEEVYALTRSTAPKELEAEEITYATMKYKNGAIGTVADSITSLRDHSTGVIGSKGGVSEMLDGVKPLIKLFWETDKEFGPAHVIDPDEGVKREDGWGHFFRCLKEGKQTNVPVREAWYSLKVCHAMRRSVREGRPIKIE